ncbi:MAG: hypothetical protein CL846_08545 [Crocinitomicaceae bacterium]|nr:hypothetical protein [Crocinitomicaceae bacterium]|tara:strand:- start:323 stop:754 length:432 start_codon:yes stop_codon:yes gene_type:complete
MRRIFVLSIFYLCINSCTIVGPAIAHYQNEKRDDRYTHEEYMDSFNTLSQIVEKFGYPTSKKEFKHAEVWYFNLGENNHIHHPNERQNKSFSTGFIEFHIDKEFDFVTHWKSEGVDYGNKVSLGAQIIGGIIIDGLIIALVIL